MLIKIGSCEDFWVGERKGIMVHDVPVLIVRTEEGIFAYHDRCPHAGACLSAGYFKNNVITCARHEWQFDACTGMGVNPKKAKLKRYLLKIDDHNNIWIDLEHEN